MADYLNIAGRIRTTASDGVGIEAQEVKDLNQNKSQQQINADVQTELGDRYTKEETYNRDEIETLVDPTNYVSVVATNLTTDVTDLLPAEGATDTIYRIGNWDGTQYDPTVYALYSWNGTTYVCLAVRSFVGEVYDISVNHPDGQGNPTPYADLAAAIGTNGANIPADIRRGGMSIKFIQGTVQSSDNKYIQARCMAQNFTTDVTQWQGVDSTPTAGSQNLVTSGGVKKLASDIAQNAGLIIDDEVYHSDDVIMSDTSSLKVGDVVYYKMVPTYTGAGIRLWNGSTQIATYGKSSGATVGEPIEGSFVVPQNLTKITAVWSGGSSYYFTLTMKSDIENRIIREDVNAVSSKIDGLSKVFEQEINVTTNTTYPTAYIPVVGEKIYLRVNDPNDVLNGKLNLKFMNGSSTISQQYIYTDRQYIYTIPQSCSGLSLGISSTMFSQAGNIKVFVKSGIVQGNIEDTTEISKQVGETYFNELLVNGNLINKNKIIEGYILDSSGVPSITSTSSTIAITDFIEVLPNSYIAGIGIGIDAVCQYNSNKEFISKSAISLPTQINANTKYIRAQFNISDKETAFLINKESYLAAYEFYKGEFNGVVSESSKVSSEIEKYEGLGKNLYNKNDLILNRIYDGDNIIASTNGRISKKIPVLPGHRYFISHPAKIFNKTDEIIGTTTPSAAYGKYVTMPLNASYIRVFCSVNSIDSVLVCQYDGVSKTDPTYEAFTPMVTSPSDKLNYEFIQNLSRDDLNKGYFAGKKLTVDGDSITHDQGLENYWQYVVKGNLKMDIVGSTFTYDGTTYTIGTRGIAGSRIAVGEEQNTKPYCLVLRYQELPDDADLIIIAGGTNDWAHDGVQLGTMADNTNVTFYGALHILCKGLIEKYPTKQIVFMTPIKRGVAGRVNNNGNTLKEFVDAIIEVCGYYGIPVCDMFRNCCMNPDITVQQQAYFADDTHPNDAGQLKMGNLVSGFVNSLV